MKNDLLLYDSNKQPVPIKVVFSARRKRSLGMKVTTTGVVIRAPKHCSHDMIKQFIHTKQQRILKQRARKQKQAKVSTITYDDNNIPLSILHTGTEIPVYFSKSDKKHPVITHNISSITMSLHHDLLTTLTEHAKIIKKTLEKRQRKQAVALLTQRTITLSRELNLSLGKVIIKSYKSKYGQCKGRDISLDWKLIRFPPAISDHIIYHELAHLTHKHHQRSFRTLVEQYDPQTKKHKKRLKEHGSAMHSDW